MLYNYGNGFFYINHFSSIMFFFIQFGKALNYSGLLVLVHNQMVQSYARAERIQQLWYVIINPQTENGTGVGMTS